MRATSRTCRRHDRACCGLTRVKIFKKEGIMAGQILVPLRRDDRIEEIISYVDKVTQPGMKVVFLVRYPADGFAWLQAHWGTMETGINMYAIRQMVERYSLEGQERLAKQRVFPACAALRKKGVEVAVGVYAGGLRRTVRSYTLNADVHLIIMRGGIGLRIKRFLRGMICFFGVFKLPSFSPVLLVHPGMLPKGARPLGS
jgi:hypothetical protein